MWRQPSKLEGLLPPRLLEYRHVTALAHGSLLAPIQTQTFKQEILNRVKEEQGECSLEHLGSKTDGEIKKELLQYPGVGPKTAACVLMFCLGRYEFPVVSFAAACFWLYYSWQNLFTEKCLQWS